MANAEKYRSIASEIKNRSVASGDANGISARHFPHSFYMQPRVKPIVLKNSLLFLEKLLYIRGQLFEFVKKIIGFMNFHRRGVYSGGKSFVALRYDFLISLLFEYSFKLSSGIKRTSFRKWSLISSSSFARRFKTLPLLSFLVIVVIS